jgi:hypothetical protein
MFGMNAAVPRHSNTRFQQSASLGLKSLDNHIIGGQAVSLAKRFAVTTR